MKKKLALLLAVVMLATMALTACGGNTNPPAQNTGDPGQTQSGGQTQAPAGDKMSPQELKVAYNLEPASLAPQTVALQSAVTLVGSYLFDTLVTFNSETNSVEPCVAESWTWVDDTTLELKLRQDVYSHDGHNIVADDVQFMMETGCATAALARYYGAIDLEGCAVVDQYTYQIKLKSPNPTFLYNLCQSCFCISSKAGIEAAGGLEAVARNPVSATGRYKFVEWADGDHITVTRNEDYWGEKPYFENVLIRFIPDDTSRLLALQSGDVDAINKILSSQVSTVSGNPDIQVVSYDNQYQMYNVFLNCTHEALSNVKVRQAMNYAVNRQAALAAILFGEGTVADGPFPAGFSIYADVAAGDEWSYDLEKAKALMKEAGYENGFEMTLILMENQMYSNVAEFVNAAWEPLGIKVNISMSDSPTFFSKLNAGEYDAYSIANSGVDYLSTLKTFDDRLTIAQGGNTQFKASDPDAFYAVLDQLYTELDNDAAKAVSADFHHVLRQEVPVINMMNGNILFGCKSGLTGYSLTPMGDPNFATLTAE